MKTHTIIPEGQKKAMSPCNYIAQAIAKSLRSYPVERRLKIVDRLVNHNNHLNQPCIRCLILKEYRRL